MDDVPELKDRGSENGAPQRAPFFTYTEKNKTVSRGNSAADAARVDTETLKIATLSDTHYLSPDMIKNTEDFTEHLNSDRKMFAESDAFLRALLDTVKKARRILLTAWYTGSRPAARNRIRMV